MCDVSPWFSLAQAFIIASTFIIFSTGILMYLDGYFEPERALLRYKLKLWKAQDHRFSGYDVQEIIEREIKRFKNS